MITFRSKATSLRRLRCKKQNKNLHHPRNSSISLFRFIFKNIISERPALTFVNALDLAPARFLIDYRLGDAWIFYTEVPLTDQTSSDLTFYSDSRGALTSFCLRSILINACLTGTLQRVVHPTEEICPSRKIPLQSPESSDDLV